MLDFPTLLASGYSLMGNLSYNSIILTKKLPAKIVTVLKEQKDNSSP
jgi:hypothetical protein